MSLEVKLSLLILAVIAVLLIYSALQTRRLIAIGTVQTEKTAAFESPVTRPQFHFLVIGDSSAVGVGAVPPEGSVAGRLAADFPTADIQSLAVSGSKVADAIKQLESLPVDANYDLILIQIGGNDIVRRTPYDEIEKDASRMFGLAKAHTDNVVQLTSGNVGTSKLLPFWSRWYFTLRTKKVREIFIRVTTENQVHYIDLFRTRANDPYAQDPKKYYSPDFFHPSADGYGDWYSFVKPVIHEILQN